MSPATEALQIQLAKCRGAANPFDRFNSVVMRGSPFHAAQRQIGQALADPAVRRVAVTSGHIVGKSRAAGSIALAWLTMYPESGVVLRGPSLGQIKNASWAEVVVGRKGSPMLCRVGDLTRQPPELRYGEKWKARAIGGTGVSESLQGFHPAGPVLIINDESSGMNDAEDDQALDSLKPIKRLDLSNPIRGHGMFYDLCQRSLDDPSIRLIKIPSTASPDIHLDRSPRGLADATWLRNMALEYGADSQTYRVRVLAEFPDGGADLLIPSAWLDALGRAAPDPAGHRRLAMDLGLGTGGDDTTWLVRDDNCILHFEASKRTTLADAADKAAHLCSRYNISAGRVSWDAAGIGAEFDNRLRGHGLIGCQPFVGGRSSRNKQFANLRSAAYFAMRKRLDPTRNNDDGSTRPPFYLPPEFLSRFRRECRELTFDTLEGGAVELRLADEVKAALRHSPDYSVTLAQSFAFP